MVKALVSLHVSVKTSKESLNVFLSHTHTQSSCVSELIKPALSRANASQSIFLWEARVSSHRYYNKNLIFHKKMDLVFTRL